MRRSAGYGSEEAGGRKRKRDGGSVEAGDLRVRKKRLYRRRIPVAMRAGGTPVPIPNTMVKTCAADGTMLGTAWESRRLPESF